jgi:hypothetical protein
MVREVFGVSKPLCIALGLGGLAGLGSVAVFERLGLELSQRIEAFPVIGFVVLFGLRGAVGSANRLAQLLRQRDAYGPGTRRR